MSGPGALPLFGDAYLADTTHLTCEEHGAYLLLLIAAWRQDDGGLPLDHTKLARITGLPLRKWKAISVTILEFWKEDKGRIFQPRLSKELDYVKQKSSKNRLSADKRWKKQPIEKPQCGVCERICECICETDAPPPPPPPSSNTNIIHSTTESRANEKSDQPKPAQPEPEPPGNQAKADSKFTAFMNASGMANLPPDLGETLRAWEADGIDFDEVVLNAVRATANKMREKGGKQPFRAKFFDPDVRQAHADLEQKIQGWRDARARNADIEAKQRQDEIDEALEVLAWANGWLENSDVQPGGHRDRLLSEKARALKVLARYGVEPTEAQRGTIQ